MTDPSPRRPAPTSSRSGAQLLTQLGPTFLLGAAVALVPGWQARVLVLAVVSILAGVVLLRARRTDASPPEPVTQPSEVNWEQGLSATPGQLSPDGGGLPEQLSFLAHCAAGLVIIDRCRRVLQVNTAALELFGVTEQDALGSEPGAGATAFVDRWGRTVADDALPSIRVIQGEEITDELIGIISADGQRRWVSASTRLLPAGPDPDAPYAVLTLVDLTTRVTADMASEAETSQLRHRALHDSLTGLPNRTMLMDRLAHAKQNAARRRSGTGLIVIDLDGFKAVNDTLGHAAGDELLVQVAVRLRTSLRASDTAARLGGDEFVVLCEDLNPGMADEELAKVSERIQALLNEPYVTTLGPADIGASVGWAVSAPGEDLDLDLVVAADEAMLSDKRQRKMARSSVMRQVAAMEPGPVSETRLRVFIVDDDPAMRLLATRILESATEELEVVGQASDGASAIEAIMESDPDLVLCDVMMPRVSGPEVVTSVRLHRPGQRFIFWSATTAPELERYQEDLGVPFVLKDRIEELPTALIEAAKHAHPGNPGPTPQDQGQLSRR